MYDFRTVTVQLPNNAKNYKIFGANKNRRTVIVYLTSPSAGNIGYLAHIEALSGVGLPIVLALNQSYTLAYRDFGPFITGDLYGGINASSGTIVATEVFEIPETE